MSDALNRSVAPFCHSQNHSGGVAVPILDRSACCAHEDAVIQKHAEGNGFSVVREFCGHGIGRKFHEEPQVLHYGKAGTGAELRPGMIFTIEPMINAGKAAISELPDGWTIVTKDRSLSAQWEHTIVVTETGVEVLTVSDHSPPAPAVVAAQFA